MQLLIDYETHKGGFIPDRYQVTETLTEGLNGNVYLGKDRATGQSVILKCFPPQARGAYLREMAAAFGLRHHNLMRCKNTFSFGAGSRCMVYEYASGGDLAAHLTTYGRLDLNQVARCLHDLLNALVHLHNLGLIHCDIKPENILVMHRTGVDLRFMLNDLGAACVASEANKGTYTIGSLAYLAPERLYDRFSYNSDLYSLGVLGYELLTGHLPFQGSPAEISRAHLSEIPCFDEIENCHLRDFVILLLEKDPHLRIASAQEALYILEQITQGDTASYTKPGLPALINEPLTQTTSWGSVSNHACYTVENGKLLRNILILHDDREPLVGLEYDNYIRFLAHADAQPWPIIEKSCAVQILNSKQLAYVLRSSIFRFDIDNRQRTCIYSDCNQLVSFYLDNDRLLWFDTRSGHVCNLRNRSESIYRSINYLFQRKTCWYSHNRFMSTAGKTNEEVELRDQQAKVLYTWKLDGPIIALVYAGKAVLAISLSIKHSAHFTAWRIQPDKALVRFDMPTNVTAWSCTPGHLFWIVERRYLQGCGVDLCAHHINKLPLAVEAFNISSDHRFFVTISSVGSDNRLVNIWKLGNRTMSTAKDSALKNE